MRISDGSSDVYSSDLGTRKPKFGSVRNSASFRLPSSAAFSSARVALIGIRLIPSIVAMPPVQPVLTSQHWTPPLAMRSFRRSEEHTSELQSLLRISYAVFCLKKKKNHNE